MVCNSPPQNSCDGNFVRIFSSPGACNNGQCSYPETGYACANGCYSGSCILTANTSCPVIPIPACAGSALIEEKDNMGCIVRYICKTDQVCGNKVCEPGESQCAPSSCRTGEDGRTTCTRDCGSAYCPEDCSQNRCPSGCDCRFGEHGELLSSFCQSEQRCDNNNVCDKGEDQSCRDCIGAECPLNRPCPDGSSVKCERSERGCNCEPCRLEEIPSDCRQETDQSGLIRVVCDRQRECPPVPQDVRLKCSDEGGIPRFNKDHSGCNVFQCDFGGERGSGPVFAGRANCPSPEAVIESLEKCRDLGLPGVIGFEGGCKIGKCQQREENRCKPVERSEIDSCRSGGGVPRAAFDDKGCKTLKCEQQSELHERGCERDLPKEAYDRCAGEGGQLVVRRDKGGCVSYSNCLRRGNAEESFVEDIDEIPGTTELLSIAFKLEDLKLEFDKLAKKTNDIAEYYKSTGSSEENRFRRVSDMFSSAKDKVDEVKSKLRNSASDISKDDVLEIKQDLRYLKDVVLKDILFVMLGSGDEIEEIKSGATRDCGTDESCFDRAFRVCQPLTFRPEGREGPKVEVTGLEGDACVMKVSMDESRVPAGSMPGINPPYEMTCKIQKYSLGVSNPEEDVFPYCTGNLVELMKQFGDGKGPPGVPGKCSGEECKDYCSRGPIEAKECLQYMGQFLPPEAKQGLEAIATGRSPGGFGEFNEGRDNFRDGPRDDFRGGGEFEGEFRDDFGGGEFRDDFRGPSPGDFEDDFGHDDFQGDFNQGEFQNDFNEGSSSGSGGCSGCLNNGVCDQGECSDCTDCRRR